ncbi:MAG: hypothetical protein NVSMB55_08170 [Mycobacteriales bacterium]
MSRPTRLAAFAVAGCLTAGVTSLALAGTASAAGARYNGSPVGTVNITPSAGTNQSAINYTTSAACPSGDSYYALLFGNGLPDAGEVVTSKTSAGFSSGAPVKGAFQNTPQFYADKNNTTLSGTYDVVVRCTSGLSTASLGDFQSTITFSSPTAYTASSASPSPSASASATSSPSATPSATSTATISPTGGSGGGPLTLSTSTPDIQPNQQALLQATGSPNTTLELMCYSRPNTTYFSARKSPTSTGSVTFTLLPGTNTRCYVRYLGDASQQSPSVVVNVHTTLSLSAIKVAGVRTYSFRGRNLPRIAGQLITLYRIDKAGKEIRTSNLTTDSSGIYRVNRTFTGTGTYSFVVRTSQTLNNAAGKSNVYRITIT